MILPPPGTVDLWSVDLAAPFDNPPPLSAEEERRARRFRFPEHQRRFRHGRAALRRILAKYLATNPSNLKIDILPGGKPYLPDHPLHFNLSNSADHALIAVASSGPVGVDLEFPRKLPDCDGLAQRFFSEQECLLVAAQPTHAHRIQAFLQTWTAKEAVLKASGSGLRIDLASLETAALANHSHIQVKLKTNHHPASTYHCQPLNPPAPAIASLATSFLPTTQLLPVNWHHFPPNNKP